MSEHTSRVRPPTPERAPRKRGGAYRVRSDPAPEHRVAIEVAYTADAKPNEIRAALADVIATALAELDKRLGPQAPRRQPPAGNENRR